MDIYGYPYIPFGCNTIGVIMTKNIGEGMRRLWSRDLQNIVTAVRNKTFVYEEKEEKPIDWRMYNLAQVNELADMLEIIKHAVDIAEVRITPRPGHHIMARFPGRPRTISESAVVKLMLLQTYFGLSNRISGGMLRVFNAKLGISENFTYKTIERGYDPEQTWRLLYEVFTLTNEWSNFNEDTFGTDGTGDPTTMKINYETKRADQRKKKNNVSAAQEVTTAWPTTKKKGDFQYSVISAGIHTKIIAGFATTGDHHIGELSQFNNVMKQAHKNAPRMKIMLGDGLYANRPVCRTVSCYSVALYSVPKSNATLKSKGVREWKRMTYELVLDPQGFLNMYHDRSISESVNSMMKRREPTKLRKRLPDRKDTEEYLKVIVHNLRQCCYLTYLAPELTKTPLGAG
jgi:transposase